MIHKLLVVDIGNTNIVIGLFRGNRLRKWRIPSRSGGILKWAKRFRQRPSGVIVSSVVPALNGVIKRACRLLSSPNPIIVGPKLRMPIAIKVRNPRSVGADRIVNAVAAYTLAKHTAPLLVIDFGTATTFDYVTPTGEFLGGAIAPGLRVINDALSDRCAQLPRVPLGPVHRAIGRDTKEAIQSGVILGYAALADGMVERIKKEGGRKDLKVIATGGLGPLIVPHTRSIRLYDPDLTLKGLRILFEWNKGSHLSKCQNQAKK